MQSVDDIWRYIYIDVPLSPKILSFDFLLDFKKNNLFPSFFQHDGTFFNKSSCLIFRSNFFNKWALLFTKKILSALRSIGRTMDIKMLSNPLIPSKPSPMSSFNAERRSSSPKSGPLMFSSWNVVCGDCKDGQKNQMSFFTNKKCN